MLRVLGPIVVDGPDGPVSVGGPVPRRILSALLVRPGTVVPVDGLLDAAWGDDPPPSAERTLVSHITRLREALAHAGATPAVEVERRDAGYRLVVGSAAVDAGRLEQILLQVKDVSPIDAVPALREALSLWRPPAPFADLQDTAYPAAEAARLIELRGSAVEALVAALLDVGDSGSAAAEAEARLGEMPFRERLWELLVLALYRQGRQGDALEAYRRARVTLSDELGVDPGPRLRRLEAQVLAQDPGLLAGATPIRIPCPYRGLARYDAGDAELFVGRERLVDELVARLIDERFLVVVGPSGAGKSSLVRAGLMPALEGGALPGSDAWSVILVVPGSEPLGVLEAALAERPDVLIVDQAEEALLADDGSCLIPFGDQLLTAAADKTRVVLVLRADFFGLLAGHAALARRAGPATVLVGAPDERALRRIITEPAARVGLRVEPELADLIVSEVRDRPGVLPVLSTALVRTWEQREGDLLSVASYRAGGGVEAALQRVGEEAWAALDDDAQRSACRRLLLRLAVDEDGSWVRRWARRAELVRGDDQAAVAALAVLTARRLVVARADDLGIAHEALLSGWPRLHDWLEDGRSRAAVRERLAIAAAAWEQADHDSAELYQGTRLQAALDTAAASPEDLTSLERAFLVESSDEADRQLDEQRARADREAHGRRRARLVAAGLAVALVFAASAGTYAITKQRQADTRQRQAERAALVADASRLGALARAGGDYDRSLLLAAQAVALDRSPTTESDLFATLLRGDAVLATLRAAGRVSGLTFTPDGRSLLASSKFSRTAAGPYGQLQRWSTQGGPVAASFNVGDYASGVSVADDGRLVVFAGTNLEVLDPSDGHKLEEGPELGNDVWSLVGGGRVTVGAAPDSDTDVLLWRPGSSPTRPQRVNIGDIPSAVASCGTQTACVLTDSGRLIRIRLSDGTVEGSVRVPPGTRSSSTPVANLAAGPDGRTVAVAGNDGLVRLVDARTGHVVRELGGASRDARVLAFSPDGTRIAAGDFSTVLVWRTDRGGLPERFDVHGGRVLSAAWSPDGSTLATGSEDGTVIVWDTTGRRRVGAVLTDALGDNTSTLWPVPGAIVVAQVSGRLLFVDPSTGTIHPATDHTGGTAQINTARAGRAGTLLVTADATGLTQVWDVKTRRLLGKVDLPAPAVPYDGYGDAAWVSPDGTQAAAIRNDAGPIVFDPVTRKVLRQLPPLPVPHADLATVIDGWTADGRSLLISQQRSEPASANDLLVVDARTGAVKLRLPTGTGWAEETTMDPAGRFIALALNDGTLLIRDAKDGHALAPPLRANDGEVFNVSVSPDGRYIVTNGDPPRVTVWDTRTFRQVGVPLPLDVNALDTRTRFAPDGRLVVTNGNVLRAFTIDPDAWLARACREAGRSLTRVEFEEVLPGRPYRPACT
jgi:WD40 repeat protein/DNA-binding SARP family transcriptional activator